MTEGDADGPVPVGSFVSTVEEWHYLAGGFCLGFPTGWLAHAAIHAVMYG